MRIHENDDYFVAVFPTQYVNNADWVEAWGGCFLIKAIWKYIYFNFKYPKHSVKFVHCRYY